MSDSNAGAVHLEQRKPSPSNSAPRSSMTHNLHGQDSISDAPYRPLADKASGSKRNKKYESAPKKVARWVLDNQIALSLNLIALLFLTHICMPQARKHTSKFFTLGHHNSVTGKYAVGQNDFYFVSFCVLLLTGVRAGCMEYVLAPLAKIWGISKKKDIARFTEQGWVLAYYNVLWPVGVYLYYISPYSSNLDEAFLNWPERELNGPIKAYILVQLSYCIQEVFVINVEDRRKDHWQMLTHHFVTIALIYASYVYHMTRIGHLILVLMDFIDIVLPLAKCLKYLGFTTICDVMFGFFILSWFITRHVLYVVVCNSVYTSTPRLIKPGCYHGPMDNLQGPFPLPKTGWVHYLKPFLDPASTVCWDTRVMMTFMTYLGFLEVMMIMWFALIMRVAMRVLSGKSAEDVRSDSEAEQETEEEGQPFEEEVGVEALNLKGWERRTSVKKNAASTSSGVRLSGHSHTKELLNRIGCEKQID